MSYTYNRGLVLDVECGSNFSTMLTSQGLWTTGRNEFGQLGFYGDSKNKYQFTKIIPPNSSKIVKISTGFRHQVYLTDAGEVYAFGFGSGALGNGDVNNRTYPTLISTLSKIEVIKCGLDCSYFINNDGIVYCTGYNSYGQLGLKDNTTKLVPTPIPSNFFNNSKIVDIKINPFGSHVFFLSKNDDWWCCGSNSNFQLGFPNDNESRAMPLKFPFQENHKIKAIEVGEKHTLVLTDDRKVFSCGNNEYGQCGINGTKLLSKMTEISVLSNLGVIGINAGRLNSFFSCENGDFYVCGDNKCSQIFSENEKIFSPIKSPLKFVRKAVAGINHCLYMNYSYDMYISAGSNKYGEIGLGIENTKSKATRFVNMIHLDANKIEIFKNPEEYARKACEKLTNMIKEYKFLTYQKNTIEKYVSKINTAFKNVSAKNSSERFESVNDVNNKVLKFLEESKEEMLSTKGVFEYLLKECKNIEENLIPYKLGEFLQSSKMMIEIFLQISKYVNEKSCHLFSTNEKTHEFKRFCDTVKGIKTCYERMTFINQYEKEFFFELICFGVFFSTVFMKFEKYIREGYNVVKMLEKISQLKNGFKMGTLNVPLLSQNVDFSYNKDGYIDYFGEFSQLKCKNGWGVKFKYINPKEIEFYGLWDEGNSVFHSIFDTFSKTTSDFKIVNIDYFNSYDLTGYVLIDTNFSLGDGAKGNVHKGVLSEKGNGVLSKAINFGKKMMGYGKEKNCAVKTIQMKFLREQDRIKKEIALHLSLRHKNIVQCYGYTKVMYEKKLIINRIVTEFCSKLSLVELIKPKCSVGLLEKLKIFKQIADGMRILHKIGIVHRDLKLENILLTSDNTVKIIDFGESRLSNVIMSKVTLQRGFSPYYIAPERIKNFDMSKINSSNSTDLSAMIFCDKKTDVYSFGMCVYFIIFEKYRSEEDNELLNKCIYEFPEFRFIPMMKSLRNEKWLPICPRKVKEEEQEIIKLMFECIRHKSEERPSFESLCWRIDEIICSIQKKEKHSL